MKCRFCGRELTATANGSWHDEDYELNCTRVDSGEGYFSQVSGPHKPVIDTVDALEAWLDAP